MVYLVLALVVGAGVWFFGMRASVEALLNKTIDAFRLGDGEVGEALFERLRPRLRGREVLVAAERLYREARVWEHALSLTEQALAERPQEGRALRLAALLKARLLRPDGIDTLREWVRDHPAEAEPRLVLCEQLLRLRRVKEGIAQLRPWVAAHPRDLEAVTLLGKLFFYAGQREEATTHLEAALALRGLARRSVVGIYDNRVQGGVDVRMAAGEQWEEAEIQLLLEQLHDASAPARGAALDAPAEGSV
jgi:tetratricopeptide (TPR) repeat protein